KIEIGEWVPTAEEVMSVIMSNSAVLMTSLRSYLPRSEDPGQLEANLRTIGEFLGSDAMLAVPFNRLAAGLWAGLAHRIANDAHRPAPNQGTVTDIDMVSVLLVLRCDVGRSRHAGAFELWPGEAIPSRALQRESLLDVDARRVDGVPGRGRERRRSISDRGRQRSLWRCDAIYLPLRTFAGRLIADYH